METRSFDQSDAVTSPMWGQQGSEARVVTACKINMPALIEVNEKSEHLWITDTLTLACFNALRDSEPTSNLEIAAFLLFGSVDKVKKILGTVEGGGKWR